MMTEEEIQNLKSGETLIWTVKGYVKLQTLPHWKQLVRYTLNRVPEITLDKNATLG